MIEVDRKLYIRMQGYISAVEELMELCNSKCNKVIIQQKYSSLKSSIKEEARFLEKVKNRNSATDFAKTFYIPSIIEASAFGLEARINGSINEIQRSLFETEYKLTKYKSKDEWLNYK